MLRDAQKERFWEKVEKKTNGECWPWKGQRRNKQFLGGYGIFEIYSPVEKRNRKIFAAHRLAFELHHSQNPGVLNVCHACDHPGCCNPDHLFLGTPEDNMRDMKQKDRSRMLRGDYKGELSGMSKLKEVDVFDIRNRLKNKQTQQSIAELYNVTQGLIWQIKAGRIWKHLT